MDSSESNPGWWIAIICIVIVTALILVVVFMVRRARNTRTRVYAAYEKPNSNDVELVIGRDRARTLTLNQDPEHDSETGV